MMFPRGLKVVCKRQHTGDRLKHTLVLIRHGESTWNQENKFTGWYDCPLSSKGQEEAQAGGKIMAEENFKFSGALTSTLKRANQTLDIALRALGQADIPVQRAWELNERHYGALQGLDKQETVNKYGIDQVNIWRRSYDVPPPECELDSPHYPANDPKYAFLAKELCPRTESLKTTLERVIPFWAKSIAPRILSGENLIIAAHGNSLRALVKYLDNIPEDVITELNIPTAVPLVYELDDNLRPMTHQLSFAPLSGRYLGNQEEIRQRIEGVKNQTK